MNKYFFDHQTAAEMSKVAWCHIQRNKFSWTIESLEKALFKSLTKKHTPKGSVRQNTKVDEQTPTNTGSPKLSSFEELWDKAYCWYTERVINGEILGWRNERIMYEYIARQLRASA